MELTHYFNESAWASKFLHDFPQAISTNGVELLGQVDKDGIEVRILLYAFFLKLASSKYHVNCITSGTKSALTLWE